MGQHTVNARMLSHALTLFSPYSKLKCGVGSPIVAQWQLTQRQQWGVCKPRIVEGSDRPTNQMLNLIFPSCYYTAYLDRFSFNFKRNKVKKTKSGEKKWERFYPRGSCYGVNCWNQRLASWTLKLCCAEPHTGLQLKQVEDKHISCSKWPSPSQESSPLHLPKLHIKK